MAFSAEVSLTQLLVTRNVAGSKERCVDGSRDYSGVRVLRLRNDGAVLLSGGADGLVMIWSVAKGAPVTPCKSLLFLFSIFTAASQHHVLVSGRRSGRID